MLASKSAAENVRNDSISTMQQHIAGFAVGVKAISSLPGLLRHHHVALGLRLTNPVAYALTALPSIDASTCHLSDGAAPPPEDAGGIEDEGGCAAVCVWWMRTAAALLMRTI